MFCDRRNLPRKHAFLVCNFDQLSYPAVLRHSFIVVLLQKNRSRPGSQLTVLLLLLHDVAAGRGNFDGGGIEWTWKRTWSRSRS